MTRLARLLKHNLTFGGTGGSFTQPPFWARDNMNLGWSTWREDREAIAGNFEGYVTSAIKGNGIVFACTLARMSTFAEATFKFQRLSAGRPGDLWGDPSLALLETPWPNATTGDLLARMEMVVSGAGNWFGTVRDDERIRQLRPDWVTILTGSPSDDPFDLDAKPIGYIYQPPGRDPIVLPVEKVAHYAPIPDPEAQWKGMSWITPVVREIEGDSAANRHKLKFFENGTTANFVVSYDAGLTKDQFLAYVAAFNDAHKGADNAYKTIHLGGGADVTTVGADLRQIDFKVVQGAGETRIAAASGVGAVIAQLSEGMAGSSLNQGNYAAARRRFADMTIRPLWRNAAGTLAKLVTVPSGNRLWYDDRDIPFLQADQTDASQIRQQDAATMASLIAAGYAPDSVTAAVTSGDLRSLKHTGLVSVQLQQPGSQEVTA